MDTYKTKDLYEAAFLVAKEMRLIDLEGFDREKWFVFSEPERCKELVDSYWNGEESVNALSFADSIKRLKDRIFARR